MRKLLADENFSQQVIRLLRLRDPGVDLILARDVGLGGIEDPYVLAWAAEAGRIVLTHDFQTMPGFAFDRVEARQTMPGMIAVQQDCGVKLAAEQIQMILVCTSDEELFDHVLNVPF